MLDTQEKSKFQLTPYIVTPYIVTCLIEQKPIQVPFTSYSSKASVDELMNKLYVQEECCFIVARSLVLDE